MSKIYTLTIFLAATIIFLSSFYIWTEDIVERNTNISETPIDIDLSNVVSEASAVDLNISISATPNQVSICGDPLVVDVEIVNNGPDAANNVVLNLDAIQGITFSTNTINAGNIANGSNFQTTITVSAFPGAASTVVIKGTGTYVDGGTNATQNINFTSSNINVVGADLSINSTNITGNLRNQNVFDAYLNSIDTLKVPVANGGSGFVDEFTYYVVPPSTGEVELLDVIVAGQSLTPNGPNNGDTLFFNVTTADINRSQLAANPPYQNPNQLNQNEFITFCEVYRTLKCEDGQAQPIRRAAYWGCAPNERYQESNAAPTGIRYDFARPRLVSGVYRDLVYKPGCFIDENPQFASMIVNVGTAPAKNVKFRINMYGGDNGALLANSFNLSDDPNTSPEYQVDSIGGKLATGECVEGGSPNLYERVEVYYKDVNLMPGDTLYLSFNQQMFCNACLDCSFTRIHHPVFVGMDYTDNCDKDFNIFGPYNYDPYTYNIQGYIDGDTYFTATEPNCVTFNYVDMFASWLYQNYRHLYPNARWEIDLDVPAGLDLVSASFTSSTGVDVPITWDYMDSNNSSVSDTATIYIDTLVRYGPILEVCFDLDCDEIGACTNLEENISFIHRFTADYTCASKCVPIVDCPKDYPFISEPCPGVCPPCDGITVDNFSVDRINFGERDLDNNAIADDGSLATNQEANTKRYIEGDTLSMVYEGVLQGNLPAEIRHAIFNLSVATSEYTIVGGELTVVDASSNSTLNCPTIQVVPNGDSIQADVSVDKLMSCTDFTNFTYGVGDSISLTLKFRMDTAIYEGYPASTGFYPTDFSPSFELAAEENTEKFNICGSVFNRLLQVSISSVFNVPGTSNGGCNNTVWFSAFLNQLGFRDYDEFPNEIRRMGTISKVIYEIPSYGMNWIDENLLIQFYPSYGNSFINFTNLNSKYFTLLGDTSLIFDVSSIVRDSINENYTTGKEERNGVILTPYIVGGCGVEPFISLKNSSIIYRDHQGRLDTVATRSYYRYLGGADLQVTTSSPEVEVTSSYNCAEVTLTNPSDHDASYSYLNFTSEDNNITIVQLQDLQTGAIIEPDTFGIYQVGNTLSGSQRRFLVCGNVVSCDTTNLRIDAGWDCIGYPETKEEASCSNPSNIRFITVPSNNDAFLVEPTGAIEVALCDTIEFVQRYSSTQIANVDDILFDMNFPAGMDYVPMSFEIAYPVPFSGDTTWVHSADPTVVAGNNYRIDITSLNPVLDSIGLVGQSGFMSNENIVLVRWKAVTSCGYLSGSRMNLETNARSACGDALPTNYNDSDEIRIIGANPDYTMSVSTDSITLNACSTGTAVLDVSMTMNSGSGSVIGTTDSVKLDLPYGVSYVGYTAGANAVSGDVVVMEENGVECVFIPLQSGLGNGDMINFSVELSAMDVQENCGLRELQVQAFQSVSSVCNTTQCNIRSITGQSTNKIGIVKPNTVFDFGTLEMSASPVNSGVLNYSLGVTNAGEIAYNGVLTIELYEDVNENGLLDLGEDMLVRTINPTVMIGSMEMTVISGSLTIPPADLCNVLARISTTSNCVCQENVSNQLNVEIDMEVPIRSYEICSGASIEIGPEAVTGFNYKWSTVNGGDVGLLSNDRVTPTTFSASNTTGSNLVWDYVLRSNVGSCYTYDTIQITIFPEMSNEAQLQACVGGSIFLPGVDESTSSNYMWTPTTGLNDATLNSPLLSPVPMGGGTYTLNYTDANGCAASKEVRVVEAACDPNTMLGDTVWYDLNRDGFQDSDEPGVSGVTVYLYNADNTTAGNHIGVTQTDANGYYVFDNLPAGNYVVQFVSPEGFSFTSYESGSGVDSLRDSNAGADGYATAIYLPNGVFNHTLDAGLVGTCNLEVAVDSIGDCMYDGNGSSRLVYLNAMWEGAVRTRMDLGGPDSLQLIVGMDTSYIEVSNVVGDSVFSIQTSALGNEVILRSLFVNEQMCMDEDTLGALSGCSYDLALRKDIVGPSPVRYGDTIEYRITVLNQDSLDVTDVEVRDYRGSGLLYDSSLNPMWQASGDTLIRVIPSIAKGDSVSLSLYLVLEYNSESDAYLNISEISSFSDTNGNDVSDLDSDSTPDQDPTNDGGGNPNSGSDGSVDGDGSGAPGDSDAATDEDDHDPALIEILDLALRKTIVSSGPYEYGEPVTFEMTVYNQGNVSVNKVVVSDYVPSGLMYEGSLNAGWEYDAGSMIARDTLTGVLMPGDSVKTQIQLILLENPSGDYVNVSEISYVEDENGENRSGDDVDSNPDEMKDNDAGGSPGSGSDDSIDGDGSGMPGDTDGSTDEDDQDPAYLSVPKIALTKSTIGVEPASSGVAGHVDVRYKFELRNNGNEKLINIKLADDLTEQLGVNFYGIVEAPMIVAITDAEQVPSIVSGYNGGVIDTIFNGMEGCMNPGERISVELVVELANDTNLPLINEGTVMGTDTMGTMVMDMDTAIAEVSSCYLEVVCPQSVVNLSCASQIPEVGSDLSWFEGLDGFSRLLNSCGTVSVEVSESSNGGRGCEGDTLRVTRQIILIDSEQGTGANRDTCEVEYVVVDQVKPIVMNYPLDLYVNCDDIDSPLNAWLSNDGGGVYVDNCGGEVEVTAIAGEQVGSCSSGGEHIPYTFEVRDSCGNFIVTNAKVVILDTVAPEITTMPMNLIVECDGLGNDSDLNNWLSTNGGGVATDNCSEGVIWSYDLVSYEDSCSLTGIHRYRFTVEDSCGNRSTSEALFSIIDSTAPMLTSNAMDELVDCNGSENSISLADWLNNHAGMEVSESCGAVTWSNNFGALDVAAACSGTGGIEVIFSATDGCGNTVSDTATYMIQDTIAPEWSIEPVDLYIECNGSADPYFEISNWLSTNGGGQGVDECSEVIYSHSAYEPTPLCGTGLSSVDTIVFTITDGCNNRRDFEAVVTVLDSYGPEIVSPAKDTLVECDGMNNSTDLQAWLANNGGAVAEDACSEVSWNTPVLMAEIGGCGNTMTLRYMFNAVDACGNVSVNTLADFVVQDTTSPVIDTETMNLTVECDGTGNDTDLDGWLNTYGGAMASDVCGGNLTWSYDLVADEDSCGITGIQLYRFTVVDACGNSSETEGIFTIEDTSAPVITGGADYSGECDQSGANNDDELLSWLNNQAGASASDVCGGYTWSNNYHIDNWVDGCNDSRNVDVTFYATDMCGNVDSVTYNFSTGDNTAPVFTNCPRPPVIVDAPEGWCSAYVNFSLPLATDNCGVPIVEQTDTTGLSTGDLFPVGLTTLEFTATDSCGNSTVCELKIIVNDYHVPPSIVCPNDTVAVNDFGMCGAVVNNLSAVIEDNCPGNMSVVYVVKDETGAEIGSGIEDVSGYKFPVGVNEVTYTVYDQPLFLITEVLQDGTTSGLEVGNFGAAVLDISCAKLLREVGGVIEEHIIPNGTKLNPGEVYTHDFSVIGEGVEASYSMMFIERTIDSIRMNVGDLVGANIIRVSSIDTDSNEDFRVATVCNGGSYGAWNPELPHYAGNGSSTALQSEAPSSASCSFKVEVKDVEAPMCAMHDTLQLAGLGTAIAPGMCVESVVTISASGKVGDVNVNNLDVSIADASELTLILTSPSGTKITLFSEMTQCSGTADVLVNLDDSATSGIGSASCGPLGNGLVYSPQEAFKSFYGEESAGDWVLSMYVSGTTAGTLNGFELEVLNVEAYAQGDTTIANDANVCGGTFSWTHPIFDDNCCEGTMEVTYSFENTVTGVTNEVTEIIKTLNGTVDKSGKIEERYFEVGVTTISYTLTDKAGNKGFCGFVLTVEDREAPQFPNGCADLFFSLDAGECTAWLNPIPEVWDNCGVDTIEYFNVSGDVIDISMLPIGENVIVMKATDIYGNMSTCEFKATVIEYVPDNNTISCNDHINFSLGPDCMGEITVDMMLEGNQYGCYDHYCIVIKDSEGNIHANKFDESDVNQTFEVSIVDCDGDGNLCWGTVKIEQKLVPEIVCPNDTVLYCNQDAYALGSDGKLLTGELVVETCAPSSAIRYDDQLQDNGVCGEPRVEIIRTWKLDVGSGGEVTCEQKITILPFENSLVSFPKDYIFSEALSCSEVASNPDLTKPSHTGYPKLNGEDIFGESYCDINVGYWDEVLQDVNCPSAYSILRHWIIQNECEPLVAGVNPIRHIQSIKVEDNESPTVIVPDTMYVTTSVWGCSAEVDLPSVVGNDNCSEVSVAWYASYGEIVDGKLTNLLRGYTQVTGYVKDACGNSNKLEFVIKVTDTTPPVAVSESLHTVSLSSDGVAKLYAESLDDGSHDGCGKVVFRTKRVDNGGSCGSIDQYGPVGDDNGQYNELIHFCCADVGDTIQVLFQVCDDGDGDGTAGNSDLDNCTEVEVGVLVQDKLAPVIECPQSMDILCTEVAGIDWENEELLNNLFGEATAGGTCNVEIETSVVVNKDCAESGSHVQGYVIRSFKATNTAGTVNCTQKLRIIGDNTTHLTCDRIGLDTENSLFDGLSAAQKNKFGWDAQSYWCSVNSGSGGIVPSIEIACGAGFEVPAVKLNIDGLCTEAGVEYKVDTFDFAGGACKKYVIKYEVIDNCKFDENFVDPVTGELNPYHSGNGYYSLHLEVNAFDSEGPEINCAPQSYVSDDCEGYQGDVGIEVTDNCTSAEHFGYQWRIDVGNDNTIDYPTTGWYNGSKVNASALGLDALPIGEHKVYWVISDGCGNTSSCGQVVKITSGEKAPTPKCYDGISTSVMPSAGSIDIWAKDFDAGSVDNCSGALSFTMIPEKVALESADAYGASKGSWTFTCDDLTTNGVYEVILIRMYVTDVDGNYDYCTATLRIDDTENVCEDTGSIVELSGSIVTEKSEGVEEVKVVLKAENPEFPVTEQTTSNGEYSFNVPQHYDYTIEPGLDANYLNGVTTLDIVMIQKHILGIDALDSPYQLIAADVNRDCKVTGTDIVQLRKLLLGLYENDDLPQNTSWRFVEGGHEFVDPTAVPCDYPEVINLNSLEASKDSQDFKGVKIGDVNLTNTPNVGSESSETRSGAELRFELEEVELTTGEEKLIGVMSRDYVDIHGWQMALEVPRGLEIVGIEGGALDIRKNHVGMSRSSEGIVMISYNTNEMETKSGDEVLFYIRMKSSKEGVGSEEVSLNRMFRSAEAYRGMGYEVLGIHLGVRTAELEEEKYTFRLEQNEPNPFIEKTQIGFELEKAGEATIQIYDSKGVVYKEIRGEYTAGYHTILLTREEIGTAGVLYYTLRVGEKEATKTMIIFNR